MKLTKEDIQKYSTDEEKRFLENEFKGTGKPGVVKSGIIQDIAKEKGWDVKNIGQSTNPKKFARKCDECGKVFNDGYVVNAGDEYYCSDKCLNKHYSSSEWKEMTSDIDNSDSYYTSWEDEEEAQFYEDGEEIL